MAIPDRCGECGKPITGGGSKAKARKYCTAECRLAFTRRRRDRGAELYDFLMQNDHETVKRLKEAYKQADNIKRGGRPSWLPLDTAAAGIPMFYGKEGDKR